ncbi:hypothetical protein HPB50_027611 [Hyalomma asiaticum]|nr:hypothetical protein HPB50_027611 [Hyalomma asiaticum]
MLQCLGEDDHYTPSRTLLRQCRSETELFLAALSWLGAKWPTREQHVVELLKCVRFSSMSMEEAVACFHPPLLPEVTSKTEVREMLNNAVW